MNRTDPVKSLLSRAAAGKGIVLDPVACSKVAAALVMESMKVESLIGKLKEAEALADEGAKPKKRLRRKSKEAQE